MKAWLALPALPALALAACASVEPASMKAPESLAAAETAFAAHSVRENMLPAFLANFSADGVFVRSGWINANADLANRENPPIVLDWRPVYVEVAASGELGVSSGPSRITSLARPSEAPTYGQYVSVWRRRGIGERWKVEVDLGITHPQPVLWDEPLVASWVSGARGTLRSAQSLGVAEEAFSRESRATGARAAYAMLASERFRFYRAGSAPALNKAQALTAPGMSTDRLAWRVERAEVAFSGDFGYARGSYASADAPGRVLGHYLRVWRVEAGEWKVALDVTNALAVP